MNIKKSFILSLFLVLILVGVVGFGSAFPLEFGIWQPDTGSGTVEWSTAQAHSGLYSAYLQVNFPSNPPIDYGYTSDSNEVYVLPLVTISTLNDLNSMSFWYYRPSGTSGGADRVPPQIDVWLDTDHSGGDDEWLLGQIDYATTFDTWVEVNLEDITWIKAMGGTIYGTGSAGLVAAKVALGTADVLGFGVQVGSPATRDNERTEEGKYYIDDIEINGVIYDFELPNISKVYIEPEYPNCKQESIPVWVYSTITDESGIQDYPKLMWKIVGGDQYGTPQMSPEGENEYSAIIGITQPKNNMEIEYKIEAYDLLGNKGETSYHYFTYDCSPPETTIEIGDPQYEYVYNATLTFYYVTSSTEFTLTATDDNSDVDKTYYVVCAGETEGEIEECMNDENNIKIYEEPFNIIGDDGMYVVAYFSVDNAGNWEMNEDNWVLILLDNTPPEVVLTELNEFYKSVPINLEFTYSDDGSGVKEYKVYKKRLGVDADFVDITNNNAVLKNCNTIESEGEYTTTCEFWDGNINQDGDFEFKVKIIDNVENLRDSNVIDTILDRWGPFAVILDSPEGSSYFNYQPLLSWFAATDNDAHLYLGHGHVSGIKEYELVIDDRTPVMLDELSYQTSGLSEGAHTWQVRANDNAGNYGEWSVTRTFTIDTTPPVISNVDVNPKYVGSIYVDGTITASATVTDDNGVDFVTFELGDEDCSDYEGSDGWACDINTTTLADGEYNLVVTAVDVAKNEEVDDLLIVTVDNTAPSTAIMSPAQSLLFASDFNVSVSDSDGEGSGLDECFYRVYSDLNGNGEFEDSEETTAGWTSRDCDGILPLTVGEDKLCRAEGEDACKLWVKSIDNLGNDNWRLSYVNKVRKFSIDWTHPPEIEDIGATIFYDIVNDEATSNTTLHVTTNKAAICKYDTRDVTYSSMENTFDETDSTQNIQILYDLPDGSYTYYVRCKDRAENVMPYSSQIQFEVDTSGLYLVTIDLEGPTPPNGLKWNTFYLPRFMINSSTWLNGNYSVEKVLSSIEGSFTLVRHYNGTAWTTYEPGRLTNDLTLTEFNGDTWPYFIAMNATDRIEILP